MGIFHVVPHIYNHIFPHNGNTLIITLITLHHMTFWPRNKYVDSVITKPPRNNKFFYWFPLISYIFILIFTKIEISEKKMIWNEEKKMWRAVHYGYKILEKENLFISFSRV